MAIDGGMRNRLEAGTKLVARYKGADYVAEVVTDGEGKTRYRLADGREFKSPSAAASAVMGGSACNGWRFWSLDDGTARPATKPAKPAAKTAKAQRPRCDACGKSFVAAKQLEHHRANADRLCRPAA